MNFSRLHKHNILLIALALASMLFISIPAMSASTQDDHSLSEHESGITGPNGGQLAQDDDDTLEVNLVEEGGEAHLVLWVSSGGKPVRVNDVSAKAVLTRPGGEVQTIRMQAVGEYLKSTEPISEPHFFEVDVEVSWEGRQEPLKVSMHKEEGLISLSKEQIVGAGLEISEVGSANLENRVRFPGEIKFNADWTARIVPRVSGVVQQVSADLGQTVKKGDVLATLSSSVVADLRSEWLAASRRRELVAAAYRREQKLWKEQVSAQQDYQQARTALQEADIAVQNAAQKLLAIGAQPSSKELSLIEIRAPFDGVIVEKDIALGEAPSDSESVFTISDLSSVWAEFVIAPKDIQLVKVGESARVSSTSFAGEAAGRVSYIGSLVGQQTRAATARVVLKNPDMAWRPGLFVTVEVVVESSNVSLAVGNEAIQTIDEESIVFVEVPGGFLAQPVKLGKASSDSTEILTGLKPGMRYVTANAFVLKSELGKASADHAH
ncbi:efflux RND transporter periplasmic adaptor subunit [Parapusillimonas sp. JC17]|uniref:efflux RND transporter periplasmic adaptor subunit n=1 Tax=Parapusillimonas sp. JC17 TaxID=3445768 RepID=UPI003F9F3548